MMRTLLMALIVFLPWRLKRRMLVTIFRFELSPSAWIGLSWLGMKFLRMGPGSRIGHFNVFKSVDEVILEESSSVGRFNLITCVPSSNSLFYQHIANRHTALVVGAHSAITIRHLIDCNAKVEIGKFTTVGGYNSQILTHSIDVYECRQDAKPISLGEYCFVGTQCVILGGSCLPSYSVLGAGSVLRNKYCDEKMLYAGVPARRVKPMPPETKYWVRKTGRVN